MNKTKSYSLYLALGLIIFSIVTLIMSINLSYSYINTKEVTIENMKKSSRATILSLKDSLDELIAAYAVNEYNNLITNELNRRDIFAIIVEDYNMGKIFGKESHFSGKIKQENGEIIKYDPKSYEHKKSLEECFYSDSFNIMSDSNTKLGRITIYISDKSMEKDLEKIIIDNIKNTIFLSLLLTIFLFIAIRIFILKPISDIIKTIGKRDKDGLPLKSISKAPIIEIDNLVFSINKMISSIKKSRRILKSEQNRLEYLLQLSPIAVRIARNKGEDVIFANHAYSKLLRVKKEETIHQNPKDYYANKTDYEDIIAMLENGETIYNRLVELNIDNNTVWALSSYMNIDFEGEEAAIGWFYDVTNEKRNEAKLYEALELQTTIFDNSGYLIIRTDEKGIIKQINKETERMLGYKAEELIDKCTPEKIHLESEIRQRTKELSQELNKEIEMGFNTFVEKANLGTKEEKEWTYVSKEGLHIPVFLSVTALRNKDNEIFGYLGVSRDITQNKVMESQAKLASMGEMIGNIAHQWRQPLSVISTISSGVKVKSEFNLLDESELTKEMEEITLQAQYLSKTIDDFRNFIKNQNDKKNISISTIIEKTLSIFNSTMTNNSIKVQVDIQDDLIIEAFENQLIQAIINILNNSKDALNDNLSDSNEKYIFIQAREVKNNLLLTIKDTGGGISAKVIEKVFDPYFTTKHQSIGTGIGLSLTYQIITEHHKASIKASNQTFEFQDNKYTGACFEILFKR